jgi:hypothetical protein
VKRTPSFRDGSSGRQLPLGRYFAADSPRRKPDVVTGFKTPEALFNYCAEKNPRRGVKKVS